MHKNDTPAPKISWRGEVPVSEAFGDPYYSFEDGAAEARHVFIKGTALESRIAGGFHIAELGFGTGLNFAIARDLWRTKGTPGRIIYTGFECAPMARPDLNRAIGAFPELAAHGADIATLLTSPHRLVTDEIDARLIVGDARACLPAWQGAVDAWFLDGFAPARNPELWEPPLLQAVFARTRPGGRFATYSAAGDVRRALGATGFVVTRQPGFGRKRHMTTGYRPE